MAERVLLIGGTGKTGRLIAERLAACGVEARIATRSPVSAGQIRFDWKDPASHDAALAGATSVYLVAPSNNFDPLPAMRPFLEQAVARASGRLVLLSASSLEEGGPMMGEVHAWLRTHARCWTVLRPSWFMQNFVTQHLASIRNEGCIYSATGDGRVPFIDAADIAAVAVTMLLDPSLPSRDHILTGPEALSYDASARLLAAAIGRPIRHLRLSSEQLAKRYLSFGLPEAYAATLAEMDDAISRGAEDRTTSEVETLTGQLPTTLARFFATHREDFAAS